MPAWQLCCALLKGLNCRRIRSPSEKKPVKKDTPVLDFPMAEPAGSARVFGTILASMKANCGTFSKKPEVMGFRFGHVAVARGLVMDMFLQAFGEQVHLHGGEFR